MDGGLYMDAVIQPNRSLSERGFVVLIAVITAVNVAAAAVFMGLGAHFVPVFMAIDVAAVATAFAVSFKAGRNLERVQVSAYEVRILRQTPRASAVVWESPTAFTRVKVERDVMDGRVTGCRLALSGRETAVAQALSPKERAEFVKALETALWRAKRGSSLP